MSARPVHPMNPTPLWLGKIIDATEINPAHWMHQRYHGRRRFLRRYRALGWAIALTCLWGQLSMVRQAGASPLQLLSAGEPSLLVAAGVVLVTMYAMGGLHWWLRERKFRRMLRAFGRTPQPTPE